MRILVVEDDLKIAQFVTDGLQQAGFVVDRASDGETGFDLASTESYDAAVIDIMLPKMDGLTLIEQLRHQDIHTPVIILSARQSVADRVRGLQTGGDDYLTKPFAFAELLARVQALIRRGAAPVQASRMSVGDLTMDLLSREVTRGGKKIDLNPREFTLLEYLMRNVGRVVSKTMILDQVWGYHFDPQTNVVDVLVCRLRNKIDKGFSEKMTHTIRGVGYVLKDPEQPVD
jgi:two-component system OmpR family response regulator